MKKLNRNQCTTLWSSFGKIQLFAICPCYHICRVALGEACSANSEFVVPTKRKNNQVSITRV